MTKETRWVQLIRLIVQETRPSGKTLKALVMLGRGTRVELCTRKQPVICFCVLGQWDHELDNEPALWLHELKYELKYICPPLMYEK